MRIIFILFIILSVNFSAFTQRSQKNDLIVSLREEVLNKMIAALGEIKGSSDYSVAFVKGKYYWFLQDPKIQLIPDSAVFTTDAKVKVGNTEYTDKVKGKVAIKYNESTNQIAVKIIDAVFEVYTEILGAKFSIKKIQLADYFTAPFIFEGPMTMNTDMEFTMPDDTKKILSARPSACDVKIGFKEIVVSTELGFKEIKPTKTK